MYAAGCTRFAAAFPVEPEILLVQNRLEKLALPFRENEVCRLRQPPFFGPVLDGVWSLSVRARVRACFIGSRGTESGLQSLERAHGAAHALAIADTPLAAHSDLKDRLTAGLVFNDCHIPDLKPPGFIRTEARVCREQHVIVKLFGFPLVALLLGSCARFLVAS